jgi:5-(carboxyamino)imidazole ribonucleotide mutase
MSDNKPLVAILMGSKSDWDGCMKAAADTLDEFGVTYEARVLSAHRTPTQTVAFVQDVEKRGCEVFIGGAGGAAHLCGVIAAHTTRPVLAVPVESKMMGLDSLLSSVQMPAGIPVGTLAIGKAGATNAALLAISILANNGRPELHKKIQDYRDKRAEQILNEKLPTGKSGFVQ